MSNARSRTRRSGHLRRGWQAFRAWRRSRPFWAGLLTVLGGLEIVVLPLAPLTLIVHAGIAGISSILMGILMIVMGISMWAAPHYRVFAGIATILFSLTSLLTSNFGGFLVGMLLGIVGGALAVSWNHARPTGHPPAQPSESPPPTPDDGDGEPAGDDRPERTGHDGLAAWSRRPPARRALALTGLLTFTVAGLPALGGLVSPADAAPLDPVPLVPFAPPTDCATTPQPSPSASPTPPTPVSSSATAPLGRQPASASSRSPGPPGTSTPTPSSSGGGGLPGFLDRIFGGGRSPTAHPTPAPTPTPTPTTRPTPGPLPALAPRLPAAPPPALPAPPRPSALRPTFPPGVTPYPCITRVPVRPRAAPAGQPLAAERPFFLGASRMTMTGLTYQGVVAVPTRRGPQPALLFTARAVDLVDMINYADLQSGQRLNQNGAPGKTVVAKTVTMYVTEISGKLFGLIPVTFSPAFPPPLVLPNMFFTDAKVKLAFQNAQTLVIPGLDQYVRAAGT